MDLDSALEDKPAEGATATDMLRADHREFERLLGEFNDAGDEPHARRVALQALCMQLELHDTLETSVFYPALRTLEPERVDAAEHDHAELRRLVHGLRELDHCDAGCEEALAQLQLLVERHVREEEDALFARVEQQSEAWLRDLGLALVKRKEQITRSTKEFEAPAT